ncbi:MAG: hypothetical protein HOY75_43470 [Streptomyces sp.]|nr:hypothetical protein [Streptomyces sp.]
MKSSGTPVLERTALSTDPLSDTPLPQLLAAHGVELVDSRITHPGFFGAFMEQPDGSRTLSMPVGRSDFERDAAARMLLADGLGLGPSASPATPHV